MTSALSQGPGRTLQRGILGSPTGPVCDSSGIRTDAPGPGHLVGATETFGVCSEAQTLLYCFNINTFHCLHHSSILSFHIVTKRLELQTGAVTVPKVMDDVGGRIRTGGQISSVSPNPSPLPHPCSLVQGWPTVSWRRLGRLWGWAGAEGRVGRAWARGAPAEADQQVPTGHPAVRRVL